MAIGILESSHTPHPHGTVLLADDKIDNLEAQVSRQLKHGTGNDEHVVLVPQPSDDPNDPLVGTAYFSASIVSSSSR
jgi:hypothetical protein